MTDKPLHLQDPDCEPAAESPSSAPVERRVLAVLFADVTNSTALYRELGDTFAKAAIDECFEHVRVLLPKFDGRLVKTIGDEILCVFPTADQAVLAASEMQVAIAERSFGGRSIQMHIGLHHGPVLVSAHDVYGDTVNIAGYLTAVAGAQQIVASEAAAGQLSAVLKSCVRPVFRALLKGSQSETLVYQVVWSRYDGELTEASIELDRRLPQDLGALVLEFEDQVVKVNAERPLVRIGRAPECDLVVPHRRVTRQHLTIQMRRAQFHLTDQSINGTWVTSDGGSELHVLRAELVLSGAGVLSLGCRQDEGPAQRILFRYDRRSAFRLSDVKAEVLPFRGPRR